MIRENHMNLAWRLPTDYNQKLIGSYDKTPGSYTNKNSDFDYLDLLKGRKYSSSMDRPSIYFPLAAAKITKYDCLWLLGRIPLVSERLANIIIAHCAQDVELIAPAKVYGSDAEINSKFFILNAVNNYEIIDLEQSETERDEDEEIIFFKTKYLKKTGMGLTQIARDRHSHDLIISKKLADNMIDGKLKTDKGLGLYEVHGRLTPYRNQA
jgi:hypothetical protein